MNTFSKTATRALTTMLDEVTIQVRLPHFASLAVYQRLAQTFDIIEPSTSNMTGPNAPLLTCAASVAPTSVDAAVLLWRAASFPFNRILVGVSTHGYAYPGVNKLMKSTRSAFSTEVYNRHASLASGTCDDTVPRGSRVSLNQLIASSVRRLFPLSIESEPTLGTEARRDGQERSRRLRSPFRYLHLYAFPLFAPGEDARGL